LSKIHAGIRLSGPLGSGNRSIAAALELVALHFCANFLRLSQFRASCQANLDFRQICPIGLPGGKTHALHSPAAALRRPGYDDAAPNFKRSLFTTASINDAHAMKAEHLSAQT
jgi:hypothetical protein